jgi:hypothetical protein
LERELEVDSRELQILITSHEESSFISGDGTCEDPIHRLHRTPAVEKF